MIGIGNEYASDDSAGLLAARRLKDRAPVGATIVEHGGEGAGLMECWRGAAAVVLVDATSSGAEPGTISRFDVTLNPLPAREFARSTHAFGLPEAIEVSRSLGEFPGRLVVYGIEGRNFSAGCGVSPEVSAAIETVVQRLLQEIDNGDVIAGGQLRRDESTERRGRSPGLQPA